MRLALLLSLLAAPVFAQSVADPAVLVPAAREQIGVTVRYDPAYVTLAYPDGDVPADGGVCTDVIIRALRSAFQIDLQREVHEDMAAHFSEYPQQWDLSRPDKNIDHRRVLNLEVYFARHANELPENGTDPALYQPGDLVTCTVPPNLPHIMIVSDRKSPAGTPLVIHNIGRGTQEENRLFSFPHTAHYRLEKAE